MTENTAIIKIIDEITACRNITLEQLHMLLETDDMQEESGVVDIVENM